MYGELYSNFAKDDSNCQLVWTSATPQQVPWQNVGDLSNVSCDGTAFYSFTSALWEVMAEAAVTVASGQKVQLRFYFSDNTGLPFPGSDTVITTFGGYGSARFQKTMQSGANTPVSVWAVPVDATYPLTVSFYQGSFTVRELGIKPQAMTTANYTQPSHQERSIIALGSYLWVGDQGSFGGTGCSVVLKMDPLAGFVDGVDLAPYGFGGVRRLRTDGTYVYCCSPQADKLAIINPSTNAVVGLCSSARKVRDVAFDGVGNFYVNTIDAVTNHSSIEVFSRTSVLAGFPTPATASTTYPLGVHLEQVIFGAGFIWGTVGNQQGDTSPTTNARIIRIDPSTGTPTNFDQTGFTSPTTWGIAYLFGSVWVTCNEATGGGFLHVLRFDPGTTTYVSNLTTTQGFPGDDIVSDGTYVWTARGDGSGLVRIDPATNTIVSSPSFPIMNTLYMSADPTAGFVWAEQFTSTPDLNDRNWIRMTGAPGSESIVNQIFSGQGAVRVSVNVTSGKNPGDSVLVAGGGTYTLISKDISHFLLLNMRTAPTNAAPGTVISSGAVIT